ncbi:hypothetical protein INR49_021713 [Caranx melampygus]|nr:hypothetical protein INR49_021713 [Caranx melampygus]
MYFLLNGVSMRSREKHINDINEVSISRATGGDMGVHAESHMTEAEIRENEIRLRGDRRGQEECYTKVISGCNHSDLSLKTGQINTGGTLENGVNQEDSHNGRWLAAVVVHVLYCGQPPSRGQISPSAMKHCFMFGLGNIPERAEWTQRRDQPTFLSDPLTSVTGNTCHSRDDTLSDPPTPNSPSFSFPTSPNSLPPTSILRNKSDGVSGSSCVVKQRVQF